jgi:anaerobic C4-dicarboxylate transporter DcuA
MAIATIASQQAINRQPVSAATAAMIGLLAQHHVGLTQILLICVPSTLLAVVVAAMVQLKIGKELKDDPEYQRRLKSGEVEPPSKARSRAAAPEVSRGEGQRFRLLGGVALVVLAGIFPALRTVSGKDTAPVVVGCPSPSLSSCWRPRLDPGV